MNITVRGAGKADYPALCELMRVDLGVSYLDVPAAMVRFERIAAHPDWRVFVAEADGLVVGFLSVEWRELLHHRDGSYAEIMTLAVSERIRRSGAGSLLVAAAEEWAVQRGATAVTLHSRLSREGAHLFYERQGYEKNAYFFRKVLLP